MSSELPFDIADASPAIQERYRQLVRKGLTPRFAEMLALQQPPRSMSDREYLAGHGSLLKQFGGDENMTKYAVERARELGGNPGMNDYYDPGLCRPGMQFDPQAFVPAGGGRGYVKRLCEERGVGCSGPVEVKAREDEPAPPVVMAERLVNEGIDHLIATDPKKKTKKRAELREEVIATRAYRR